MNGKKAKLLRLEAKMAAEKSSLSIPSTYDSIEVNKTINLRYPDGKIVPQTITMRTFVLKDCLRGMYNFLKKQYKLEQKYKIKAV